MTAEFKKVSNIAFFNTGIEFIFRCLMTECGMNFDGKRDFENHLRQHLNDGRIRDDSSLCLTCNARINAENVIGEYQHMLIYHVNNVEIDIKKEIETNEPQPDILTGDQESENVSHTSIELLKPIDEIKIETNSPLTTDYDIGDMFVIQPENAFSEVPTAPDVLQITEKPKESENSKETESKHKKSRSSSHHRHKSSTRDKSKSSSNAASKEKRHSKSESLSSKKSSSLKSSEKLRSDNKSFDKNSEKSGKTKSETRSRKSSSSSSKSHSKSSEKPSSNYDSVKSTESNSQQKRSAPSSPCREVSPDKKLRLEFENDVVESNQIDSSAGCDEKVEEDLKIENDTSPISQNNVQSTSTVTDENDEIGPSTTSTELVSEYGAITFKKIIGKIPKKIPVVLTGDPLMPSVGEIIFKQSVNKALHNPLQPKEPVAQTNASQLMSWVENLKRENFKYERQYQLMTTKHAIVSLYKCMDANCSFSNSNFKRFLEHLEVHARTPSTTQFYQLCPYCKFKNAKPFELTKHIRKQHSYDLYQCSLCFFRSPEPGTVREHLLVYHKDLQAPVYKCCGNSIRPLAQIMAKERKMFDNRAGKIYCKYCNILKSSYELWAHFKFDHNIHLESELPSQNPNILNCFYCSFNTMEIAEMSRHMIQHPTEARTCYSTDNQILPGADPYMRKRVYVNNSGLIENFAYPNEKINTFWF